jgi:hypothetical protein
VRCSCNAVVWEKRRELLQDLELDKEQETAKKTGKIVDKLELGRESYYLHKNPGFLIYGSTWSVRTGFCVQNPIFPSDIRFFSDL